MKEIIGTVIKELGKSQKSPLSGGSLRTYIWKSSLTSPETSRTESFYVLQTNVRLKSFLETLKCSYFLQGNLDWQLQLVLDKEGLQDELFLQALEARNSLLPSSPKEGWDSAFWNLSNSPQHSLLNRVQQLQRTIGRHCWNWNYLYALLGNLRYELSVQKRQIRPGKKFSGYVKTPSAVGSKNNQPRVIEISSEIDQVKFGEFRNFVPWLTSQDEDYSLLGIPAESLIYTPVVKSLREGKRLDPDLRNFLIHQPL